jgi:predicted CXXCH cytochrome family protein
MHLGDPRVLLNGPTISADGMTLRIRAALGQNVSVNGAMTREARLVPGDRIRGGPYELIIREPATEVDLAMTIELVSTLENDNARLRAVSGLSVYDSGASKRSVAAVAGLAALRLAVVYPWLIDRGLWSSGELATAHQMLSEQCDTSHANGFERVADAQCVQCYEGVIPHAFPTALGEQGTAPTCVTCHREHGRDAALVIREDARCISCHNVELGREAVTGFELDHPEFKVFTKVKGGDTQWSRMVLTAGPTDYSHLEYAHKTHGGRGWGATPNVGALEVCVWGLPSTRP